MLRRSAGEYSALCRGGRKTLAPHAAARGRLSGAVAGGSRLFRASAGARRWCLPAHHAEPEIRALSKLISHADPEHRQGLEIARLPERPGVDRFEAEFAD